MKKYYNENKEFNHIPDSAEKIELAISRLENPYNIEDEDMALYSDYLSKDAYKFANEFIDKNKITILPYLVKYRVIKKGNIGKFIEYSQENRKMDSLSYLLNASNDFRNHPKQMDIAPKFTVGKSKNNSVQKLPTYEKLKPGNIIWLGLNPIPWQVVDKKDGKVLIVSKFALECQPYNRVFEHSDWKNSSLRRWLNEDFFENIFSDDEKRFVENVYIDNNCDISFENKEDNKADKMFLLSDKEVLKYFKTEEERLARITEFAKGKILWQSFDHYCHWWLRTDSLDTIGASYVTYNGDISYRGGIIVSNGFDQYFDHYGVRPAMYLKLD